MLLRLGNVSWDIRILQETCVHLRRKYTIFSVFSIDDALNSRQILT